MTLGVIGKKLGMTQIYDEAGLCIPVTVVAVEEAVVTQVKTTETDGTRRQKVCDRCSGRRGREYRPCPAPRQKDRRFYEMAQRFGHNARRKEQTEGIRTLRVRADKGHRGRDGQWA